MEILFLSIAMLMALLLFSFLGALALFWIMNKFGKLKEQFDEEWLPLLEKKTLMPGGSENIVLDVARAIKAEGFDLAGTVMKPWGAEFKIKEDQAEEFLDFFFNESMLSSGSLEYHPVGPKILLIEQGKRLSWHYHERKDAYLGVLRGSVDVYVSWLDAESQPTTAIVGVPIRIPPLLRHRLGSRDGWAVIAEISRNVNLDHPSDDLDEIRIADDFGRK